MAALKDHNCTQIMDARAIERAITRLAHEVSEKCSDLSRLVLVGIHSRGVQVAQRLKAALEGIGARTVPLGTLDLNMRRDDVERESERLETGGALVPVPLDGKVVVLVDDVLFTGRTIRTAVDLVTDLGRPEQVRVAVLVDRGGREVPFRADFVGHNARIEKSARVRVRLHEVDGRDEVVILT